MTETVWQEIAESHHDVNWAGPPSLERASKSLSVHSASIWARNSCAWYFCVLSLARDMKLRSSLRLKRPS